MQRLVVPELSNGEYGAVSRVPPIDRRSLHRGSWAGSSCAMNCCNGGLSSMVRSSRVLKKSLASGMVM